MKIQNGKKKESTRASIKNDDDDNYEEVDEDKSSVNDTEAAILVVSARGPRITMKQ